MTALEDGPLDALVATSGSTARGFMALASDEAQARLVATPVIAAGASAAAAARDAGFVTVLEAPAPDAATLAAFTAAALGVGPDPVAAPGGVR